MMALRPGVVLLPERCHNRLQQLNVCFFAPSKSEKEPLEDSSYPTGPGVPLDGPQDLAVDRSEGVGPVRPRGVQCLLCPARRIPERAPPGDPLRLLIGVTDYLFLGDQRIAIFLQDLAVLFLERIFVDGTVRTIAGDVPVGAA